MIAEAKARPDDSRDRIIDTAESLFRRYGHTDTSFDDIAAELGISLISICRFFPNKDALVEAISQRHLAGLEEKAIPRAPGSAVARMERLILQILCHDKKSLLTEQRVHNLVLEAVERSPGTAETQREIVHSIAELILRDGIEYHLTRAATVDVR